MSSDYPPDLFLISHTACDCACLPFTSALEKVALSERLPPGGARPLNLRDRDRDFFSPGDRSGAPQRQRLPVEALGSVGTAGVVRCRSLEVQAATDLLAAELSGNNGKHLIQIFSTRTFRRGDRVLRGWKRVQ